MDRVWVRGTTGSGKTTLGIAVARWLGCPAVDLDDLSWLPDWTVRPKGEFRAMLAEAAEAPSWAVAGNYTEVRDILEPLADTIVWLDYPFPIVFGRLLRRTLRRALRGEPCCNGNRESLGRAFLSRDSILLWCVATHRRRHQDALAFMAETPRDGQMRLRHRTPRETQAWLREVARTRDDARTAPR